MNFLIIFFAAKMKQWENVDWEKEEKKIPYILLGVIIFVVLMAVLMYYARQVVYG
jgi:flagellar basal body-associated protein FliL